MAHILSGFKVALTQGRYRWRHDKVLKLLAEILDIERRKKRPSKTEAKQIHMHLTVTVALMDITLQWVMW